jgi:Mg-chelatase subunit ChlD
VVPERLVGYARKQQAVARDVIVCPDQSGSTASSVVYGGVFGAVLASIRSLRTSVVAFDTAVVDLTEQLGDPVDVLFGTQLGGGTDINRALAYGRRLITRRPPRFWSWSATCTRAATPMRCSGGSRT